jgi:pyroglutamyl-peptidase
MCERALVAGVSQTAGTFVCNHVFYGLMHHTAGRAVRGGFIHVPYLPEQAEAIEGAPAMALADIVEGLRAAVEVTLAVESDISEAGGATH